MNSFDRERLRIQRTKMLYPPGTRIVLGEMSDPYAPVPPGTRGTVKFVDDMGTIHPQWDNGRTLGLIYGEDSFRKLTQEELEEECIGQEGVGVVVSKNIAQNKMGKTCFQHSCSHSAPKGMRSVF